VRIFGVQVNSFGHSYGSGVVLQEAKQYQDVNRVVVTGYLHDPRNPAVAVNNYPANQDPKFATSGLDNGYLTSKPNTRKASFYNAATADQDVVDYDEGHKDVISLTAFLGYAAQQGAPASTNISKEIHVPVMAVVGQQDLIFCSNPAVLDCSNAAAVRAYEAPFYANAPKFKAYVVADTAHDVALHPSAQTSFDAINQWIKNPTN
jgi:pimeloyl-ACP methyl ester carboxylesterase